jgi:hypothetical protein
MHCFPEQVALEHRRFELFTQDWTEEYSDNEKYSTQVPEEADEEMSQPERVAQSSSVKHPEAPDSIRAMQVLKQRRPGLQ